MKNPVFLFLKRIKSGARRRRRQWGQTLVEYAMIIAVISIVVVGALTALTNQTSHLYSTINTQLAQMTGSH